jgi:hypothetical protein
LKKKNKKNGYNTAADWKWNLNHSKFESKISLKISETMD